MFAPDLTDTARTLLETFRAQRMTLATAESCTGGLIAALLTEIPGSSDVFTHGFITYANAAKTSMLNINPSLIAIHGAVSAEVARLMALNAQRASGADVAVAVTGIAGPGGGTEQKPVGLVHLAVARADGTVTHAEHRFTGDRSSIRLQALRTALGMVV